MKNTIKNIMYVISFLLISPLLFIYLMLNLFFSNKDSLLATFSQFFSLIPGKTGNYLRGVFYHFTLSNCAIDVVISFHTLFAQQDTQIFSGVYIGPQCNIGKCSIGHNSLLGSGVHVMSGKNQHYIDDLSLPIKDQGGIFEAVSIGEDCWIGNSSLIMANIGNHCVVGAGSVVVNDMPDNSIIAGNPARIIKVRLDKTKEDS